MSKPAKKPANKLIKKRTLKAGLPRPLAAQSHLPVKATPPKGGKPALERISKQARVIDMLRSPDGTPIASMMKLTSWQQHSVRGFLAGVVKRKLGLKLSSETKDGIRLFRILNDQTSGIGPSKRKRAH